MDRIYPFALHWANIGWAQKWTSRAKVKVDGDWRKRQRFPQIKKEAAVEALCFQHAVRTLRRLAMEDGFPGLYVAADVIMTHDELFPEGCTRSHQGSYTRDLYDNLFGEQHDGVPASQRSKWPANLARVPDWCMNRRPSGASKLDSTSSSTATPFEARIKPIAGLMTFFDNTPRRAFNDSTILVRIWAQRCGAAICESLAAAVYYETCCVKMNQNNMSGNRRGNAHDSGDESKFILVNAWMGRRNGAGNERRLWDTNARGCSASESKSAGNGL
ncbi:hypothetical protein MPSEU_000579900 [Mayamaea pseudoterrestris]|nr:hypothetical protein MPSEU_000579900 [Mayamaea pseudoterrestris]